MIKRFCNLKPSGPSGTLVRFHRRFLSAQTDSPGVFPATGGEDPDSTYQFLGKSFAFVVDAPLFVSRPKSVFIGPQKVSLIKAMIPDNGQLFASAVMPLQLDQDSPDAPDGKAKFIKVSTEEADQADASEKSPVPKYVYGIASYCAVDLVDDSHVSLNCVHKIKVQHIDELTMLPGDQKGDVARIAKRTCGDDSTPDADKPSEQKEALHYFPMDQLEAAESEDSSTGKPSAKGTKKSGSAARKTAFSSKRSLIDALKSAARKQPKPVPGNDEAKPFDSQVYHISKNEVLPTINYNMLTRSAQIKMDYLNKQIKTSIPRAHDQLPNYVTALDLRLFIDRLTYVLSESKFLEQDVCRVQVSETIEEIIDSAIALLKRYWQLYNSLKQIGQRADARLKQKRKDEYKRDIFYITKQLAEQGKEDPLIALEAKLAQKTAPAFVKELFGEMLERLKSMDRSHPEYPHTKHYLEIVASLPFGLRSPDNYDLERARRVLEESHFGLREVKKRILEFLAVGKLTQSLKGKILCFVGAPGVGKTTFAFTVAKALGRAVYRISLGGENDVTVLKGHRRTYIGSRPGMLVKSLRECQTENCVIIIDEVDKIAGANIHGDPQATLLEVLDPEQNSSFVDNYLDFPLDLSNVFFICTANSLANVSSALRDRIDIIDIGSYTNYEKKEIFQRFLLPKAIEEAGLSDRSGVFTLQPTVVDKIIEDYAREAGIRSLKKYTEKLMGKIAHMLVEAQERVQPTASVADLPTFEVTEENLATYIGPAVFERERIYPLAVTGVVQGLAYNQMGGSVLYIEASVSSSRSRKSGLKFTGSLGAVMKESVTISYSFARRFLSRLKNRFLEQYLVHVHVSEGATPKDGPSAGIALTTALVSLALNRPLIDNFPMTGEISLKGKVLKVGGLKEKIAAAKREGSVQIIVPEANREDVEFMEPEVTEGVRIIYVGHYKEVFATVFGCDN